MERQNWCLVILTTITTTTTSTTQQATPSFDGLIRQRLKRLILCRRQASILQRQRQCRHMSLGKKAQSFAIKS